MQGLRDVLSNALGNGFEWIAYIALALGIVLIFVAIFSISGEHKDPMKFFFSLALGVFLVLVFLWVVQPFGLFAEHTFSK